MMPDLILWLTGAGKKVIFESLPLKHIVLPRDAYVFVK
jgi:hypothetical protein